MIPANMSIASRYAVAVITTGAALLATSAFPELLAPMRLFFLWCAVLISAVIAGTGPGLLSTALALMGAGTLIFAPTQSLALHDPLNLIRFTLFALFAGGISVAVGTRRGAEERAKALSARLQANEQRYRTLVESVPMAQAVWSATPEGEVDWGTDLGAITGGQARDFENAVHPEDYARTWARWRDALANETRYEDEIRICVANGGFRWFTIESSPVRGDDGRILEWIGIIADVHDRKRHEDGVAFINRSSELLSSSLASEKTLRSLARLCVPALGDLCAIDLGDGAGYKRNIVEHSDPALVQLVFDLDTRWRADPDVDPIVQVLRSGKTQFLDDFTDTVLVALTHSEEQLDVVRTLGLRSWIIAPMVARGRTLGALTVVHHSRRQHSEDDVPLIEELARRAAMALDNARLYEEADAGNRAKDDFLATLSHELRTPLTAIAGWAHMLEAGIDDPATERLAVQTIVRSARAQTELIDDLLDLSRVVAGTLHLQVARVDLSAIAGETIAAATPAADAKGVRLDHQQNGPVHVRGDERRLRQIIWNLVTNAVKFTGSGGAVRLSVSAAETMARIVVSDTGRGIDPSFLPHVWERFRQADSSTSRQFGGLGLGLAVVRHLAELHGGTVHAESDGLGQGALFRVEIPLEA